MPILEEVFSWYGIDDETVVQVQRISSKVYGDTTEDQVKAARKRGLISCIKSKKQLLPMKNKSLN